MGKEKAFYKPVYNELIRVSNLYYSNCSISDMLDYLVMVSGLAIVLTDDNFHPIAARLSHGPHKDRITASDYKYEEIFPESLVLLTKNPENPEEIQFECAGEAISFFPMILPNHTYYLCIDRKMKAIDPRFEAIVQNALPFLALTIDKEKDVTTAGFSRDFYAPFFQILQNGGSKSPDEIRNICNMFNFNPDLKRVCMTIQLQEPANVDADIKSMIAKLRILLAADKYFLIYYRDFISVFLLYPVKDQDLDTITKSYVLANNLYAELSGQYSIRIGISSAHRGIQTISESFEESFKSIKVQKQLQVPDCASSYFEQSIYHILNIPELEDFRKLAIDIIAPLIEYDAANDTNFFETLQQYFHNSFNIQKTAKELFIHRNTLTYRLQHIKELLKFDFDFEHNTDALFTLYLCVCVYKLGHHKDNS